MTPMAQMSLDQPTLALVLPMRRVQKTLHWLAMPALLEYLRSHVARCPACGSQDMKSLLIHDPAEPEIGNQEVGVIFWCTEEEILRLEITVDDAMIVEVGDG